MSNGNEEDRQLLEHIKEVLEQLTPAKEKTDAIEEKGKVAEQTAKEIEKLQTKLSDIHKDFVAITGEARAQLKQAANIKRELTQSTLSKTFKNQAEIHKKRAAYATGLMWLFAGAIITAAVFGVGFFVGVWRGYESSPLLWHLYPFFATITAVLGYLLWQQRTIRSEENRLHAEYVHKSTLADTYIGYREEAADDPELKKKLLENLIETIKRNPSEVLDQTSRQRFSIKGLAKLTKALGEIKKYLNSN